MRAAHHLLRTFLVIRGAPGSFRCHCADLRRRRSDAVRRFPEAGETITISASGFAPNSEIKVFLRSTNEFLATATSDADGNTLVLSPSAVVLGKTLAVTGRTFRPILTGAAA